MPKPNALPKRHRRLLLIGGILSFLSVISPMLVPRRVGITDIRVEDAGNVPQMMIVKGWSAELIEEQIAWWRDSLDSATEDYPPALALAASRDRWDAVDIFLDYGADYATACAALEQAGETALAARLFEYSQPRRETHAIIEVDLEELLRRNKDKPMVIPVR